jgi:cytochrome oxidase Cu insertion factor (SCO1/SenC/PrrC family)
MSHSGNNSSWDRVTLAVITVAALVGLGGGFWAAKRFCPPSVSGSPRYLIDFALTDRTGRSVTRADLTNQFLVVNFVFTSCSVSCLQVSRHMARIQELVAGQNDVRLVSFTVDPRTDTPSVLAKFGARLGADTNRWLLLTGDKAVVHSVIKTCFLDRKTDPVGGAMPGGFMHADQIAVVDPRGQVRAFFDGMKSGTPHDVANTIASLRNEKLKP